MASHPYFKGTIPWGAENLSLLICHVCLFFGDVSVQIFCSFLIGLFVSYCWPLRGLCIFWITVYYQICLLQIFSPRTVFIKAIMFWRFKLIIALCKQKSLLGFELSVSCLLGRLYCLNHTSSPSKIFFKG
jgi:hypothetical protein